MESEQTIGLSLTWKECSSAGLIVKKEDFKNIYKVDIELSEEILDTKKGNLKDGLLVKLNSLEWLHAQYCQRIEGFEVSTNSILILSDFLNFNNNLIIN